VKRFFLYIIYLLILSSCSDYTNNKKNIIDDQYKARFIEKNIVKYTSCDFLHINLENNTIEISEKSITKTFPLHAIIRNFKLMDYDRLPRLNRNTRNVGYCNKYIYQKKYQGTGVLNKQDEDLTGYYDPYIYPEDRDDPGFEVAQMMKNRKRSSISDYSLLISFSGKNFFSNRIDELLGFWSLGMTEFPEWSKANVYNFLLDSLINTPELELLHKEVGNSCPYEYRFSIYDNLENDEFYHEDAKYNIDTCISYLYELSSKNQSDYDNQLKSDKESIKKIVRKKLLEQKQIK